MVSLAYLSSSSAFLYFRVISNYCGFFGFSNFVNFFVFKTPLESWVSLTFFIFFNSVDSFASLTSLLTLVSTLRFRLPLYFVAVQVSMSSLVSFTFRTSSISRLRISQEKRNTFAKSPILLDGSLGPVKCFYVALFGAIQLRLISILHPNE